MGFEEVRLAAHLRIAGILGLAERMPGIVTAPSCRKLDRIALAEEPSAFRAILVPFDDILVMNNNRRVARQPDRSALCASDMHREEQCMQRRHMDDLLLPVPTRPRKIERALPKGMVVWAECCFAIRRILFVAFRDVVKREL